MSPQVGNFGLSIASLGVSVGASLMEGDSGELSTCVGVDFSALRSAPSREFVRIDYDPSQSEALSLFLLNAALSRLQPIIEGRLEAMGIKGSVGLEIFAREPSADINEHDLLPA